MDKGTVRWFVNMALISVFFTGVLGIIPVMVNLVRDISSMDTATANTSQQESTTSVVSVPSPSTITQTVTAAPPSTTAPAPQKAEPSEPADYTGVLIVLGGIAVFVMVGVVVGAAVHMAGVKRRDRKELLERKRAARREVTDKWDSAVTVHSAVYAEWTRFLFPETVQDLEDRYFRYPTLADTSEDTVVRFTDALNALDAAYSATAPVDATLNDAEEFLHAATTARRALDDAKRTAAAKSARNVTFGNEKMTSDQVRDRDRARKIFRNAADPSSTPEFARTAMARVHELLRSAGVPVSEDVELRSLELAAGWLQLESAAR